MYNLERSSTLYTTFDFIVWNFQKIEDLCSTHGIEMTIKKILIFGNLKRF